MGHTIFILEDESCNLTYQTALETVLSAIKPAYPNEGIARMGGYKIALPNGQILLPIIYDSEDLAWERQILEGAKKINAVTGRLKYDKIALSNGLQFNVADCLKNI